MNPVYIIGSGAMGCLWGSYLSQHQDVNYISRRPTDSPTSFTCENTGTTFDAHIIATSDITDELHHIVVATKAFDALNALRSIKHQLATDAQILLLQNGMGSQQAIADEFSEFAVYACSSTEGAYKTSPTGWVHAGKGENFIGGLTSHATQHKLEQWLPTYVYQWESDITPILWRKLLINAAINPLTVIHQCKNGQLLEIPQAIAQMTQVCQELDQLVQQLHLPLPASLPLAQAVCEKTAENFSSMYQDHAHGRQTEVHFITGFVIDQCQKVGTDCPENRRIYQTLLNEEV